jgi:hypothetical protein
VEILPNELTDRYGAWLLRSNPDLALWAETFSGMHIKNKSPSPF